MLQDTGTRRWNGGWTGTRRRPRGRRPGWLDMPLLDNLDRADLSVHVVPDERRRGYGSAMLRRLEQEARERGRTLLKGETAWPYAAGPDGDRSGRPGVRPELRLRAGARRRQAGAAAARARTGCSTTSRPRRRRTTRRTRCARGRGPSRTPSSTAGRALTATLETEAPTGELEVEPEHVDAAVVREAEALIARQGRRKYNTVALDAAGAVVAYTDIATTVHEPGRAYQWGTLVRRGRPRPPARPRGEGGQPPAAPGRVPGLRRLTTYNAEVNPHMVGVNDRLGFVPVARLGEFQKRLA